MVTKSKLAKNPKFPAIINSYNEILKRDGRVNNSQFYREYILPVIPDANYFAFYAYLRRFRTVEGLMPARHINDNSISALKEETEELQRTMLSNNEATQRGMRSALNLGAAFFEKLWERYNADPESLTPFEQKVLSDSLFKAMKAQDSRIHAIGKIREDNREEAKFNRAFDNAALEA